MKHPPSTHARESLRRATNLGGSRSGSCAADRSPAGALLGIAILVAFAGCRGGGGSGGGGGGSGGGGNGGSSGNGGAGGAIDAPGGPREGRFEVVGHSDLMARGMNAALAVVGSHVYVGSRTEGATHANAGVLIVDVSDPANPKVAGQIGPPDEALYGMTSRELRALPDKKQLFVLNFACSTQIHACSRDTARFPGTFGVAETDNLKVYDLSKPTAPALVATHDFGSSPAKPTVVPHEFYLWRDPARPDRVLFFFSMPIGPPAFQVLDASDPRNMRLVATWDPHVNGGLEEARGPNVLLHSVGVTDDGKLAFLSHEGAGLLLLDVHDLAAGAASPSLALTHPVAARVDYSPPALAGTHSAVAIPGRPLAVVTDEVYPKPAFAGCPWGWARIVDFSKLAAPKVVGEYKVPEQSGACPDDAAQKRISYTAHNATVTDHLAFITWHAAGLVALDTTDPAAPRLVARFEPTPIPSVTIGDPALGGHQVTMWSTPIIKDGLVYVVDIRNGLYILRYSGFAEGEVRSIAFREGSSNLR